jgi:hypothetical protein
MGKRQAMNVSEALLYLACFIALASIMISSSRGKSKPSLSCTASADPTTP